MSTYISRRVLQSIPILLGMSVIVFTMMRLAPGDPFAHLMAPGVDIEAARARLCEIGYCGPLWQQYLNWLGDILRGDFGYSLHKQLPIGELMGRALGPTFMLSASSLLVALVVAIPMGVISALRQYSVFDYSLSFLAFVGISTPSFFAALLAIYVLALKLRLFPLPLEGVEEAAIAGTYTLLSRLKYMILPALVLSVRDLAVYTRFTRSSMLEVIRQDYVRTARAKGLANRVVVYKHALRNALIPVVTLLGLSVPSLFGTSVIIETIFSWPGMGLLSFNSVLNRDYPVIISVNLFFAVLVLIGNLLADIMYAIVDPRIRYS